MRTGYMGWADPALVANSGTSSPFLLLGDHAGREVPPELAQLGLMEADLARHIGWDIGVFGLGLAPWTRLSFHSVFPGW